MVGIGGIKASLEWICKEAIAADGRPLHKLMRYLITLLTVLVSIQAIAEEHPSLAAVRAADSARVAAMLSPERENLGSIFSDELRYAHSNGIVDSKASFIEVLNSGKTQYVGYDYEEQNFTFPAPGIALMSGRAHIKARTSSGEMDSVLSYLAVWREEKGKWRFLAWQSCRLPPVVK
jgi:hypothetical protein